MQNIFVFLDTETTGNTPSDRLCQLCYRAWEDTTMITSLNELYNPTCPISIASQAVHHIRPKMVSDKPLFQKSSSYAAIRDFLQSSNIVIIAHNAPFDMQMLTYEDIFPKRFIDTLKIVRYIDPDMEIERHNLQFLRYYLNIDDILPEGTVIDAHDALGDVLILEHIYHYLRKKFSEMHPNLDEEQTTSELIRISSLPTMIGKITFGKYAGSLVRDLTKKDRGYLEWLLGAKQKNQNEGQDEQDWIYTLETVLGIK
jgi:DNA polymerase III epsilon subunit-like protein